MGGTVMTHNQIWHAIDMFAKEHGLSCSGLARKCGLDPTTFNKSKRLSVFGQERWPTMSSIAKVLNATNAQQSDLFKFVHGDKPQNSK
jgi:phage repressor protein C with HTH and peptisase S24 domain